MAEFGIVDLTLPAAQKASTKPVVTGQAVGGLLGTVDTAVVANSLESLRKDLADHISSKGSGLKLASLTVRLSISAEGKVAFVAKGTAEACIEVVFATPGA